MDIAAPCDTFQSYPLSRSLTVPARLTHRSYSGTTFSVLVTFHPVNTVCLWNLSFCPEVLPEWQCGGLCGGGVQYRCVPWQSRHTETCQESLLGVSAAVKKYFRWSNKWKLLAPDF